MADNETKEVSNKPVSVKELSIETLKSLAYDKLCAVSHFQGELRVIETELAERQKNTKAEG
jgi:hypothetical protein